MRAGNNIKHKILSNIVKKSGAGWVDGRGGVRGLGREGGCS